MFTVKFLHKQELSQSTLTYPCKVSVRTACSCTRDVSSISSQRQKMVRRRQNAMCHFRRFLSYCIIGESDRLEWRSGDKESIVTASSNPLSAGGAKIKAVPVMVVSHQHMASKEGTKVPPKPRGSEGMIYSKDNFLVGCCKEMGSNMRCPIVTFDP